MVVGRVFIALALLALPVLAEARLAGIFGNGMVLQRDVEFPVWGWADPGEEVRVRFGGKQAATQADAQGRWKVVLGPFGDSLDGVLEVEASNVVRLERVCVGEVWFCSGQSNMAWPVSRSRDGAEETAASRDPHLRLFTVPHKVSETPVDEVKGSWQAAAPESVADFSAVAYFFGRELRRKLGVPVGLIHSSWGGTPVEAWTSREALAALPAARPTLDRWAKALEAYPEAQARYEVALERWKSDAQRARESGGKPPRRPRPPSGPSHPHLPGGLFGGMVAPVAPFGVRGVIWYQGESNAGRAEQYQALFPALIRDWRRCWSSPELPFYFVQLANFKRRNDEPGDSAWAELREAQRLATRLPGTGMAVTIDIGEASNIHPGNKQEVGRRLSLLVLNDVHGRKGIPPSGPLLRSSRIKGTRIVLEFEHAEGLKTSDGRAPRGFAIADRSGKWRWAAAVIRGDVVEVSHPKVKRPKFVRYGWADNPDCNLVNGADLPASPFRTDDWRLTTAGKG